MFALKIGLIYTIYITIYIKRRKKLHETSVGAYIENMFKWRQIVLQRLDLSFIFIYMRTVCISFFIKRNKCSINNI